jgi:polar amino acid transport system substrate-binding protein
MPAPAPTESPPGTAITGEPITATIRLASGDWPPYTGQELPGYGCDSRIVAEAFALEGVTVEYGFFPWARSYRLAASGEWDGTLEWENTPTHQEDFYVSRDYISKQEWVFFYRRADRFDWQSMADLDGKIIGVTTQYAYSDAFVELREKGTVTFEEAASDESNFKKLLAGRIDIFPMERRVGYTILATRFTPAERAQLVDHPNPVSQFLAYLLLSKAVPQNEQRIEQFNRGLNRLQENGRYDEIMENCVP